MEAGAGALNADVVIVDVDEKDDARNDPANSSSDDGIFVDFIISLSLFRFSFSCCRRYRFCFCVIDARGVMVDG